MTHATRPLSTPWPTLSSEASEPRISPLGLHAVQVGLTLGLLVVLARLALLLASPQRGYFLREAEAHRHVYQILRWPRGVILDRHERLLAGVQERYQVDVRPDEVRDWQAFAWQVGAILDLSPQEILAKMAQAKSNAGVAQLTTEATPAQRKALAELEGLVFTPNPARWYPEGALAANVLGFVAPGNQRGYYGVEQYFQDVLQVPPERLQRTLDPFQVDDVPQHERVVVLTIERELQAQVEEILDQAVEENKADAGAIVVLDPFTGAVLAMASTPRPDLQDYNAVLDLQAREMPFNWAVGKPYEPGSVFKVIVMGMALNEGVVTPDTVYVDTGTEDGANGPPVYNWNRGAWGPQTMVGCLRYSLNTCLAWVAKQVPDDRFYAYLRAFGFGQRTGVELADEQPGLYNEPTSRYWSPSDKVRQGFGQAISVTPLQMAVAAAAVANGGYLVVPHVVQEVRVDGYVYAQPPQAVRQVLRTETARTLTEMLVASLEEESSQALVPGYRVAGKTGTAEIPVKGAGYASNLTNASFVGWLPADAPRVVVYVWLHRPRTSPWASVVAAPVFRLVAERAMAYLGVPPDAVRQRWETKGVTAVQGP